MRLAGIDFGTNSVRLLVCDCFTENQRIFLTPVERQAIITQLGRNLHSTKIISEENVLKTKQAVNEFKKVINKLKPEKIYSIATSVFRDTKNGISVQQELERCCGYPIQIISGHTESELMYKGIFINRPAVKDKTAACIDLGGGSCEIIFAKNNKIVFNKSYNIGCLRSKYLFFNNDPPLNTEIDSLRQYVLQQMTHDIKKYSPDNIICFGGTATSLAAIFNNVLPLNIESLENFVIRKKDIDNFIDTAKKLNEQNIAQKYSGYLGNGRESVILSGAVIMDSLLKIFEKKSFTVTNQGILFGLLSEIFKNS